MRLPFFAIIALMISSATYAENLYLYVFFGERPVRNADVMLDGEAIGKTDQQGALIAPLTAGEHRIVVGRSEIELANFTFTNSAEQNAEITITADGIEEAKVEIELVAISGDSENAPGFLKGFVLNDADQPVADAVIYVPEVDLDAISDENGQFEIELPSGVYSVEAIDAENRQAFAKDLRIVSNVGTAVELRLLSKEDTEQNPDIENVVVLGTYKPNTTFSTVTLERESFAVTDAIDIGEISRYGDSTAASALKRVVGVTLIDDKFTVVRGINQRYTATTFNGASLPSPDPLSRVVPLDIFPTSVIQNIEVVKTARADLTSDMTGGLVNLNSRTFPEELERKISLSIGYVSDLTGDSRLLQNKNKVDFWGFTPSSRELPAEVANIAEALSAGNASNQERELAAESLPSNLNAISQTISPDISFEVSAGDTLDTQFKGYDIAYYSSFKFDNGWSQENSNRRTIEGATGTQNRVSEDFVFSRVANDINLGASAALGLIGDINEFTANFMLLRQTQASTEIENGITGDQGREVLRTRGVLKEREFEVVQFLGRHDFEQFGNTQVNWSVSYANASLNSPDDFRYSFEDPEPAGAFEPLLFESTLDRLFTELEDESNDFKIDFVTDLYQGESSSFKLGYGFATMSRERVSDTQRFGYDYFGTEFATATTGQLDIPNQDIDSALTPDRIGSDGFLLTSGTLATDFYDASWDLNAYYLNVDSEIGDSWRILAGIRVEDSDQQVNTFINATGTNLELRNNPAFQQQGGQQETSELPSLNITYIASEALQYRFAFSETLNRPDFRELANAIFDDDEGDTYIGNPDLVQVEVTNFDLRAEWYFSDEESFSAAYFYKDFSNPIEEGLRPASGGSFIRTWENGDSGFATGIELDMRKNFDLAGNEAFVSANAAFIDSEVEVAGEPTRAMQGQPDLLLNVQLGFDSSESDREYTLVMNHTGESIDSVGGTSGGRTLPDIIREPRTVIDFNFSQGFDNGLKLSAKIKNITDEAIELTQGGDTSRKYKKGTEFSIGIGASF